MDSHRLALYLMGASPSAIGGPYVPRAKDLMIVATSPPLHSFKEDSPITSRFLVSAPSTSSQRRMALFLVGGVACFLFGPQIAWAMDLYDDYLNSTSKTPFVSFLGREGSISTVGHAFVGVGVRLDSTLIVYERLFGLYPKDGAIAAVKSVFTATSGKIDSTWSDMSWDVEMTRTIDDTQKQQVLAQFDKWSKSAPQYSLTANGGINCSGMVADVASSLGLKVPAGAGSTRPWKFIEALDSAN